MHRSVVKVAVSILIHHLIREGGGGRRGEGQNATVTSLHHVYVTLYDSAKRAFQFGTTAEMGRIQLIPSNSQNAIPKNG